MKHFILTIIILFIPTFASAHAFPLEYSPDGFSSSPTSPSVVTIRFSQGISKDGNGIDVFAPDGTKLPPIPAEVDTHGEHMLSRSFASIGDGIYVVSWHGVSSEDGHSTRGAFSFFVGATSSAPELYGGTVHEDTEKLSMFNFDMGVIAQFFAYLSLMLLTVSVLFFIHSHRKKLKSDQSYTTLSVRMHRFVYLAFSLFLVSVAIVISTPASNSALWQVTRMDASRMITVTDLGEMANALRLRAYDAKGATITDTLPTVLLNNVKEGIGPLVIPVKDRGDGRYDMPLVLLTPHGEWRVAVTFTQHDAYDINATISIDYPREILEARTRARAPRFIGLLRMLLPYSNDSNEDIILPEHMENMSDGMSEMHR